MESNDKKYLLLKEKILKTVLFTGLAATLVGGLYNAFNGYAGMPVYVHLAGFLLLAAMLLLFRKLHQATIAAVVFCYFCFVYTPFAWLTLGGLYSSMSYVVYVFFLLVSILLDGKWNTFFTAMYLIEILVLVAVDVVKPPVENPHAPLFSMAFSYLIMLGILIFVTALYKRQYTSFLISNRRDSLTDVLTGLHNHRYLTDLLVETEEWYHTNAGKDYAVAVIDMDGFKQINDTYGHSTGDDVLNELGGLFEEVFAEDAVGRYGGDEFVAVFRDVPFEHCIAVCEMLLAELRSRKFTDHKISISLSIGLCSRSQIEGGDLFAAADQLLYQAKKYQKGNLRFHGK